jgi:hypothetical protein
MKAILIILVAALTGCDALDPDVQNNPLVEPDFEYEIDTWGANSEVYEFTPRANKNYICVFVMLDDGSDMSLQCFPKGK